jgi:RimJ/RimL family protein N-acetyltransferase
VIATERLILRQWTEADRDAFATILADPEVMHDYPAPHTRAEADEKLDRYRAHIAAHGFGKWAVERQADGALLGYVGVAHIFRELPVFPGLEVGWRLARTAWGVGYASEAASMALSDVFTRTDATEVVSFTAASNSRSQAVMRRIGLERDAGRDFVYPIGTSGPAVVYVARRGSWGTSVTA